VNSVLSLVMQSNESILDDFTELEEKTTGNEIEYTEEERQAAVPAVVTLKRTLILLNIFLYVFFRFALQLVFPYLKNIITTEVYQHIHLTTGEWLYNMTVIGNEKGNLSIRDRKTYERNIIIKGHYDRIKVTYFRLDENGNEIIEQRNKEPEAIEPSNLDERDVKGSVELDEHIKVDGHKET